MIQIKDKLRRQLVERLLGYKEVDGAPLQRADGGEILRTLLFPKSSATMTDIWHVVGLRGTGSDRYSVTNLFIPERYTALRIRRSRRAS